MLRGYTKAVFNQCFLLNTTKPKLKGIHATLSHLAVWSVSSKKGVKEEKFLVCISPRGGALGDVSKWVIAGKKYCVSSVFIVLFV